MDWYSVISDVYKYERERIYCPNSVRLVTIEKCISAIWYVEMENLKKSFIFDTSIM